MDYVQAHQPYTVVPKLMGYSVEDNTGVVYMNFSGRAGAERCAAALNAHDGGIGNHNRACLTRMSRNPNTRANSSRV